MEPDKIERLAMAGEQMPPSLSMPDQLLFLCLRDLYHQYRAGFVDRDTAKKEKSEILREWESFVNLDTNCRRWIELFKRTEAASTKYRKERTLESADLLLACVEGRSHHNGKFISCEAEAD